MCRWVPVSGIGDVGGIDYEKYRTGSAREIVVTSASGIWDVA